MVVRANDEKKVSLSRYERDKREKEPSILDGKLNIPDVGEVSRRDVLRGAAYLGIAAVGGYTKYAYDRDMALLKPDSTSALPPAYQDSSEPYQHLPHLDNLAFNLVAEAKAGLIDKVASTQFFVNKSEQEAFYAKLKACIDKGTIGGAGEIKEIIRAQLECEANQRKAQKTEGGKYLSAQGVPINEPISRAPYQKAFIYVLKHSNLSREVKKDYYKALQIVDIIPNTPYSPSAFSYDVPPSVIENWKNHSGFNMSTRPSDIAGLTAVTISQIGKFGVSMPDNLCQIKKGTIHPSSPTFADLAKDQKPSSPTVSLGR